MGMILSTVQEAAAFLGLDPSTIHKWVKQGKLQTYQVDGKRRIIVEKVAELAARGGGSLKAGQRRG